MKRTKTALLLAFGASLLYSCSKSSERGLTGSSEQTARLTAKSWYFESGGVDFDRDGDIDFPMPANALPACVFDNNYMFLPNGTGMASDSTQRCDSLPAQRPFGWGFANNEQTIEFYGTPVFGRTGRFKVWALNETYFTIARDTLMNLPMFPQQVNASLLINLEHH